MYRTILLALAVTGTVCAQFTQLSATDDGAHLYFSSSLVLGSVAAPTRPETRIYRLPGGGAEMFAERGRLAPADAYTSNDGASGAQVSGDGQTVAFTLYNVCGAVEPCEPVSAQAEVRGRGEAHLGPGIVQLSRNGKWAVVEPYGGSAGAARLFDLETGRHTDVPTPAIGRFGLASDGTVAVFQGTPGGGSAFGLWREGRFTPIVLSGPVLPLALSDDARTVVYSQFSIAPSGAPQIRLLSRDVASGRDVVLAVSSRAGEAPRFMAATNDARLVLYRVTETQPVGPAYIVDSATGERRAITLDPGELASAGALAGRGGQAFLVTSHGRIVKVALAGGVPGRVETPVPATPYFEQRSSLPRGSMVRIRGSLPGSMEELTGRILLNENPLPLLYAAPGDVRVQIPWELPTGEATLRLTVPSESPFRQIVSVQVSPASPAFEPLATGESAIAGIKLVRGDFSGLLTEEPQPGDIVHAYMTGLGPVRGAVQTGVPAPIGTVLPIEGDLRCRFTPQRADAETLFAGLAPGMIGIYQVSFRMPAEARAEDIDGLSCKLQLGSGSYSFAVSQQ